MLSVVLPISTRSRFQSGAGEKILGVGTSQLSGDGSGVRLKTELASSPRVSFQAQPWP